MSEVRLIDANALGKELERVYLKKEVDEVGEEVYRAVAHIYSTILGMPTIDAEPKWIPISEGLPKEDGVYLISLKGEVFMAKYHTNADYEMSIDAWRPLPKPYEVEE